MSKIITKSNFAAASARMEAVVARAIAKVDLAATELLGPPEVRCAPSAPKLPFGYRWKREFKEELAPRAAASITLHYSSYSEGPQAGVVRTLVVTSSAGWFKARRYNVAGDGSLRDEAKVADALAEAIGAADEDGKETAARAAYSSAREANLRLLRNQYRAALGAGPIPKGRGGDFTGPFTTHYGTVKNRDEVGGAEIVLDATDQVGLASITFKGVSVAEAEALRALYGDLVDRR